MDDETALRLLASIDRRVALLTASQERALQDSLRTSLLRTPARVAMFEGINGRRGSPELARMAAVSKRAAQLFIKELLELGLVKSTIGGTGSKGLIVERDEDAVIQWYPPAWTHWTSRKFIETCTYPDGAPGAAGCPSDARSAKRALAFSPLMRPNGFV